MRRSSDHRRPSTMARDTAFDPCPLGRQTSARESVSLKYENCSSRSRPSRAVVGRNARWSTHSSSSRRYSVYAASTAPQSPVKHTARCSRRTMWPPTSTSILISVLFLLLLATRPVSAVRVRPTNCLSPSFLSKNPPFLQWVPLDADAKFDTRTKRNTFQFIVWGNVTGSLYDQALPPPQSKDWANADIRNGGKIEDTVNKINFTTVQSSIKMLSYTPWSHLNLFCENALVNGSCPLPPVFNSSNNISIYDLPSMNITNDMSSSYSFASFAATMLIIFGNTEGTNIGCMSAVITPDLGGKLTWTLKIVPLIVLLFSGLAVVFASIFSPWGSSNVFRWTSNYGRDADLLRLVTPGFGDCLQYIQFIVLSGALSLSYPGFFQPVVSQAAWSTLMFNESFVTKSPGWQSVQDGIYVTDTPDGYGLHALGQLVGMRESADIWAGMMVWLCVIIAAVFFLAQAGFLAQWLFRAIRKIPEEDLRAKNIPFSVGNVIRIAFNFFLMPIVALSCFQLVAAGESPSYAIALASVTLVVLLGFASYVLLLIIRARPRSYLFDDLPTVLRYGPLYNTYSDEAAAFALIPVLLNFVRGIAIGAVQPSGISQVVLLAICEVIQIFTLHAFRPFQSSTSMNAYHTLFAVLRLACVLLMVAFAPSLGVTEGPKGWIGYAILLIHGGILTLGFLFGAMLTMVEVVARLLGAGRDDITGLTRGGLSTIFGMRQLSRRETQRAAAPSRASQLSTMAMLHPEEGARLGSSAQSGRIRSTSGVSYGGMIAQTRHRSSSVLDSLDQYSSGHRHVDTNSSYMPGTPGERSTFSFVASPTVGRPAAPAHVEPYYYRPPRRATNHSHHIDSVYSDKAPGAPGIDAKSTDATVVTNSGTDAADTVPPEDMPRGTTPAPAGNVPTAVATGGAIALPTNRPDYATREVDFYYGVRGPALNSDNPGRRLGTGPADPTGPVATATGWFRNWFGAKNKEKGKGFEVVRSSRMPPDMVRNGGFGDETPPEGIPVAMGVLRNGPIDSDDEDGDPPTRRPPPKSPQRRPGDLITDNGDPQDSDADEITSPVSPLGSGSSFLGGQNESQRGRRITGKGPDELLEFDLPEIPRKSSKRNSGLVDPRHTPSLSGIPSRSPAASDRASPDVTLSEGGHDPKLPTTSALPFVRTPSQKRLSSRSSSGFPGEPENTMQDSGQSERPAGFVTVPQHGISRVDPPQIPPIDLLGSSAELVDDFVDVKHPQWS